MWRGAALACGLLFTVAAPAAARDWARFEVRAEGRVLAAAEPREQPSGGTLTVVVEGDGRAHDRAGRPTADPTPGRAVGLEIARAWPSGPVAWLARPCQQTRRRDAACRPEDWTVDRFAETSLSAIDAAVTQLKARAGAERVVLVGWSGGGVIAAALAARRSDVAGLVTFAAPLDAAAWTRAQGLSPLNLAAAVSSLPERALPIPQVHRLGARDKVVPPATAERPARKLAGDRGDVRLVPEAHACCWARRAAEAAARLGELR